MISSWLLAAGGWLHWTLHGPQADVLMLLATGSRGPWPHRAASRGYTCGIRLYNGVSRQQREQREQQHSMGWLLFVLFRSPRYSNSAPESREQPQPQQWAHGLWI